MCLKINEYYLFQSATRIRTNNLFINFNFRFTVRFQSSNMIQNLMYFLDTTKGSLHLVDLSFSERVLSVLLMPSFLLYVLERNHVIDYPSST